MLLVYMRQFNDLQFLTYQRWTDMFSSYIVWTFFYANLSNLMLLSSSPSLIFNICNCSGGQEVENLILNDLFYHIQGELEGRQIDNKPFKELLQFLIDSRFMDAYKYQKDNDLLANIKSINLYDTVRLRTDLGLEMWDLQAWKEPKEVVETMLLSLQESNSRMLLANSKLSSLRGLVTLLYMREDTVSFTELNSYCLFSELI